MLITDGVALEIVIMDISTAGHLDLMEATWHSALDDLVTFDQVLLMVLPARESASDVTTREFNLDIFDELFTFRRTDVSTNSRARMGTVILSHLSRTSSETFDSIMKNLRMTSSGANMSTQ